MNDLKMTGSSLEISSLSILMGGTTAYSVVEISSRHNSSQSNSCSINKSMKRIWPNRILHIVFSLMFYVSPVCPRLLFLPLPSLLPLLLPSPPTSICILELHSSKHSSIFKHTPATTTQHTNHNNSYNATASMGKVKWDSAADQIVSSFLGLMASVTARADLDLENPCRVVQDLILLSSQHAEEKFDHEYGS